MSLQPPNVPEWRPRTIGEQWREVFGNATSVTARIATSMAQRIKTDLILKRVSAVATVVVSLPCISQVL